MMCDKPEILVLGTIPGKSSIEAGEYYHDNSNRMWRLLSMLCGETLPKRYDEKKAMIARQHIVIWDFYESVVRVDSSDKGILVGTPNDIPGFLIKHPTIKVIAINGYGKFKSFGRQLEDFCNSYLPERSIRVLRLPETSGLNAAWNMDRLYNDWKSIFE
jgi:G:T/U mismatch-specific DNA glycosylase